jgi:hypothetical protein
MLLIAMNVVLADAIKGAGFPAAEVAEEAVKGGLATFTGNQYNESWAWDTEALLKLETATLEQLYMGLKTHRRVAPIVGAT